MKRKRLEARVNEERVGLTCPGCGAYPMRESWLEPCDCGLKTCRCCREEGACLVCRKERAA